MRLPERDKRCASRALRHGRQSQRGTSQSPPAPFPVDRLPSRGSRSRSYQGSFPCLEAVRFYSTTYSKHPLSQGVESLRCLPLLLPKPAAKCQETSIGGFCCRLVWLVCCSLAGY